MISIEKSMFSLVRQEGDHIIKFVASDESVDRDGDIISQAGWDFSAFQKNPVFLWNHRSWDQSAIGKVIGYSVENNRLEVVVEFAKKEIDPFADMVYQKYANGFLSAVSVGFTPVEYEERGNGYLFKKMSLNEISGVNVPANANAVQIGHSATPSELKLLKRYSAVPQESHESTKVSQEDVNLPKVAAMAKVIAAAIEIQKIKNRRGL